MSFPDQGNPIVRMMMNHWRWLYGNTGEHVCVYVYVYVYMYMYMYVYVCMCVWYIINTYKLVQNIL